MCTCIYAHVRMEVSPYLCLSKDIFISLQKYLHLSPVKHILLIENHCRKQFWNCHLRLTCKIKQREKGIITHCSRQTSAWFISVLMNATACDCTLYCWESQPGVVISLTQNEHSERLLGAHKRPPSRSIAHTNRDERSAQCGMSAEPLPDCQLGPRRPALVINPAQPVVSSRSPRGWFGTQPGWDGQIRNHGLLQRSLGSLKSYWNRYAPSVYYTGTHVKRLTFEWKDPQAWPNQGQKRNVVELPSNILARELLVLSFFLSYHSF